MFPTLNIFPCGQLTCANFFYYKMSKHCDINILKVVLFASLVSTTLPTVACVSSPVPAALRAEV